MLFSQGLEYELQLSRSAFFDPQKGRRQMLKCPSNLSIGCSALIVCVLPGFLSTDVGAQQPPPPRPDRPADRANQGSDRDYTHLNRGPIHEAFAQPYQAKNDRGIMVVKRPPEPIEEVPSRLVPKSDDFQWISGYWCFEPEEQRFVWVSGIWRRAPEEMSWNPGYWSKNSRGLTWTNGFWSREERPLLVQQTPPDVKREQRGEAPSDNHFWVPGHWEPTVDDFRWHDGYWAQGYEGRVWIPHQYVWTPEGYLSVPGYWDYTLADRGFIFCPIAYDSTTNVRQRYSPNAVVRVDRIPTHLFVDTAYGHYRYGDYYEYAANRRTLYPWAGQTDAYDPLRVSYQTFYRDQYDRYRGRHDYYLKHSEYRPRSTRNGQVQFQQSANVDIGDALLAVGINALIDGNYPNAIVPFADDAQRRSQMTNRSVERSNYQKMRIQQLQELDELRQRSREEYEKRRRELFREAQKESRERAREADKRHEELEQRAAKRRSEVENEIRKRVEDLGNLGSGNRNRGTGQNKGNGRGNGNGNGNGKGNGNGGPGGNRS